MRTLRWIVVLGVLASLLAGCGGGCSCQQEETPPPEIVPEPTAEPEVIEPDTTDVTQPGEEEAVAEPPSEPAKSAPEDRQPARTRPPSMEETPTRPEPPAGPPPEPELPEEMEPEEPLVEEEEMEEEEKVHVIRIVEGPFGMSFAVVPEGDLMIGSDPSESGRDPDEGPRFLIHLDEFWMQDNEVTLRQWKAVMGELPFRWQGVNAPPKWTLDEPVRYVNWYDVQEFINELNDQTGLSFRLPTEAEWEYAARGWEKSRFWSGASEEGLRVAEVVGPDGALHEVKSTGHFNPFGLHDALGNVSEWVYDDYIDSYKDHPDDGAAFHRDPPSEMKLVRGGNFLSSPDSSRSAAREPVPAGTRWSTIGFRLVLDDAGMFDDTPDDMSMRKE